jgi:hypothetical protein
MKTPARSVYSLVAIWLLIAAVPALRDVARVQILGGPLLGFSLWPRRTHPPFFEKRSVWEKLARQHPQDARLAVRALEASTVADKDEDDEDDEDEDTVVLAPPALSSPDVAPDNAYQLQQRALLQSYDRLIARFSHDHLLPFLIAKRLQNTLNGMRPRRIAGELEQSYYESTQRGAAPERRATRENFTARDLQAAIALCKRGQRLEPHNAFFDWTLCKLLLIAWRDAEARHALTAAIAKTRYDDHQVDEWRATVAAQEVAVMRPLLWEEKHRSLEHFLDGNDYYYYEELTEDFEGEALAIIAWESLKAARRGNHALALQWAEYSMRLVELQGKSSATFNERIRRSYAELNLQNKLAGDLTNSRRLAAYNYGVPTANTARLFAAYAKKHGRADVARVVTRTRRGADALLANAYSASALARDATYGLAPPRYVLLAASWIIGVLLLLSIAGSVFGLLGLAFVARRRRFRNFLQMKTLDFDPHDEALTRREIVGGVLACSGVRALCCALAGAIGAGLCALAIALAAGQRTDIARALSGAYSSLAALSFWATFWGGLAHSFSGLGDTTNYFRAAALLLPLVLGVLHAQWRAVHRQRLRNGEGEEPRFWPLLLAISSGRIFRAGFDYDSSRAFLKLFDWLVFLAFLAAWLAFAFWTGRDWWWAGIFVVALFFAGALMLDNFMRWRRRPRRREAARYQFRLLRASLWGWLLTASALYLLLLLIAWPLRRQADARMNQVLQHGTRIRG